MQQPPEKRKRSANFSEEEKLRFVRIVQKKGSIIINNITSHDKRTNKRKEETWKLICRAFNSSGSVFRSPYTLRKLWQKLKSDAKVFQASNTGRGPSKGDNPVLELVLELTGRKSSEISGVSHCDSDHLPVRKVEKCEDFDLVVEMTGCESPEVSGVSDCNSDPLLVRKVEKYDDWAVCKSPLSVPQPPPPPTLPAAQVPVFNILNENSYEVPVQHDTQIPAAAVVKVESCSPPVPMKTIKSLRRRRPQLDQVLNVRCGSTSMRSQTNHSNSFAFERLRSEKAKFDLINLKREQETELHQLRMENERQLYSLKEKILEKILTKIEDGSHLDADIIEVAFSATGERRREQ